MNQIPNIEEDSKEAFLHLLHQVVQHTPLKLEETAGTDYDRGYIFYQDMVLRDVEELETTMWDWHHQQLQKAREEQVSNIIADYMEALGTVQLPQEVWLWIADINGKYLNKTLKENI